jgi:plasmid stabilization system protein ParE
MIRLRPAARAQIRRAEDWYQREAGLAVDLRAAIARAVECAHTHPLAAPVTRRAEGLEIRRILTRRFPYAIEYAVVPDGIIVLAVRHQARRPSA